MTTSSTTSPTYHHGVYPDARGRYGDFGGRFVPESLMAALDELEQAYTPPRADARFRGDARQAGTHLHADAPRRSTSPSGSRDGWARASTSSAKTWRTPARTRSTTRWGRDCWRSGWASGASSPRPARASTASPRPPSAPSSGLECVVYMGEEDIQPPVAQRLPHEAARRRGAPGQRGQPHAQRRHQRGDARLGDQRRDDALSHRLRRRAASLPAYRARLPVGDRPRDARSRCSTAEGRLPDMVVACVGGGSNAIGMFHPFAGDESVRLIGVEAGGRGHRQRPARRDARRRAAGRAAWRAELSAAGCAWPGDRDAQHLRRAGLSRRRAGAQLPERDGPRQLRRRR